MTRKVVFICFLVLTVLWSGFIFANSLNNGEKSSEKSSAVTEVVNTVLEEVGADEPVSEKSVRKLAHFSEFFVLSLLLSADILLCPLSAALPERVRALTPLFTAAPVFLLACIDETIQRFSDGRTAQFSDVLIDTLGGLCAAAIFTLAYLAVRALKLKKRKK